MVFLLRSSSSLLLLILSQLPSMLFFSLFLTTVINPCISGPCVAANTQNCINLITSYQCVCVPGYNGDMCENGKLKGVVSDSA